MRVGVVRLDEVVDECSSHSFGGIQIEEFADLRSLLLLVPHEV